jgi:Skp family chaperone for outer membrane proteins
LANYLDDLRKKSVQELEEIIQKLHIYHQRMHEQANYWLDAKEQLVMDAETHNKVIASLVQYAKDQQEAPKGK